MRKRYKDTVYGMEAIAHSRTGAWQLIRNECHRIGVSVPTMDKVVEVDMKTKQYNEYLAWGGTMSLQEWENDGRFDRSAI